MIIALEGVDACGKATQSQLLAKRLDAKLFSFPAYTELYGPEILGHLKRQWSTVGPEAYTERRKLDAMVFQAMQLANKMYVAAEFSQHRNIVLDRYWPSACVYAVEDGFSDVKALVRLHACLPQPDVFILVDVEPDVALARLAVRAREKDRYEQLPSEAVAKRIEKYRELWAGLPWTSRRYTVDGNRSVEEVHEDVVRVVKTFHKRMTNEEDFRLQSGSGEGAGEEAL